jgi:hypothetical protein
MTAATQTSVPPATSSNWLRDLVLGVRLAVGGGRNSITRIVLGTVGIGLAVLVLLLAASAQTVLAQRDLRGLAQATQNTAIPGVAPLEYVQTAEDYRSESIDARYLHATGPTSPLPPGIGHAPGPNEVYVSPALADLLDSPQGALLRPRFPEQHRYVISDAGLLNPRQLIFYADAGPIGSSVQQGDDVVEQVYRFGPQNEPSKPGNSSLMVLVVLAVVALLIPILLFVAVTSRIAGAQRDRRLAALRLVGASGRQVRRIAAAETLVPAGFGLVLGVLLFLVARVAAGRVELFGWSVFTGDVVPPWPLAVLVLIVVPVLSVGSSLLAMRRTVIEPLGVVRLGKPVRRRVWWRLVLIVLGIGLLLITNGHSVSTDRGLFTLALGASLLLVGVPVLLPWLLERVVGRLRGGLPSWQLAVRRLQLDSGTPARVIGGVAVVLAAGIALQTMMFGALQRFQVPAEELAAINNPLVRVDNDPSLANEVGAALARTPGTTLLGSTREVEVVRAGTDDYDDLTIADCATITTMTHVPCADGQVYELLPADQAGMTVQPSGTRLSLVDDTSQSSEPKPFSNWTVPAGERTLHVGPAVDNDFQELYGLVATPSAVAGLALPPGVRGATYVHADLTRPDELDQLRNAVAPFAWHADVESIGAEALTADQATFQTIESAIKLAALFTLGLAGVSMLVLALEQVRERRRPRGALAAAGVSRAMLARSLLWQTAVPVVIGVLIALASGIGLAALVMRMADLDFAVDWATTAEFVGATVLLVLVVTGLTLPALRGATRLSALRTE